jgi:glutamine amidotransferase
MNKKVVVIDYGSGNLLSVQRAVEFLNREVECSANPKKIRNADRVILPGVGAFGNAMDALRALKLVDVIRDVAISKTPLLGICLGMQLLFDESDEFGISEGLQLVPGKVIALPKVSVNGDSIKSPHIGWSKIVQPKKGLRSAILTEDLNEKAMFFVHSFMAVPKDASVVIATTDFGGHHIPAVISSENIYGSQFHPEKSGKLGLQIISNFLEV